MSDCSGNKAAVIVLGIYSGIITIILVAALLLLYRSMKRDRKISPNSFNPQEHDKQRNLRQDLEAQERSRANAMPISGFNITSDDYVAPSPNSPDGVIQNQEFELPNVENRETSHTLHRAELPETTRTYVELTQDPNGEFKSVRSSSSSGSDNTHYNDVLEATPNPQKKNLGDQEGSVSTNKKRLISEASIKSSEFHDVEEYEPDTELKERTASLTHGQAECKQTKPIPTSNLDRGGINLVRSKHASSSSSISSTSSSSSENSKNFIYNDVTNLRKFDNINLSEKHPTINGTKTTKKKNAPPPPNLKSNNDVPKTDGITPFSTSTSIQIENRETTPETNYIKYLRGDENGMESSSSESSPEMRKKNDMIEKDKHDVRISIQGAPESYRKVSSYIEPKSSSDIDGRTKEFERYRSIKEDSSSSHSSIEALPAEPVSVRSSDFTQHIEMIMDTPDGHNSEEIGFEATNKELLPKRSSFSSEDDGNNEHGIYSFAHGSVDIIDDCSIEQIDSNSAVSHQSKFTNEAILKDRKNSSSSTRSLESTTSSDYPTVVLKPNTAFNMDSKNKPPIPEKPLHLKNMTNVKAKLNTSFSSNGMDVKVYRIRQKDSDTETDSSEENANLNKELQRASSSSSLSSESSMSVPAAQRKSTFDVIKMNSLEMNSPNIEQGKNKGNLSEFPPSDTIIEISSDVVYERPTLQPQGNIDEGNLVEAEISEVRKCIPVHGDSYSSSEISTSEDDTSDNNENILPNPKKECIELPTNQDAILPNLVTIGRATSFTELNSVENDQKTFETTDNGKTKMSDVRGDSIDSSESSSSSNSSSSTSLSTLRTDDALALHKLPSTTLTTIQDSIIPHPQVTSYSLSLDTASSINSQVNDPIFMGNLNRKYESVYRSHAKTEPMIEMDSSQDVDELRTKLKPQITI